MASKVIFSAGPSITDDEIKLVAEAMKYGWYENMNMHIDQFVAEFCDYTGMKFALPTCNCTSAIHVALLSLGVGPGDEVVVPDITWVASAAPVHYIGATVVFADIDRKTWCLSPESFENSITEKTKAVIPVGLCGNLPDMGRIREIAQRHGIAVIEDAAESIGAEFQGRKAGTFGDIGVYSFNGTKLVVAGQGGMIVTNDGDLYERFKRLTHHGIIKAPGERYYWSSELGYNYNWTNIQAALALAQLRRIDELMAMRRRIYSWYQAGLDGLDLELNYEPEGMRSTFWLTVAIVSPEYGMKKEEIQEKFKEYNVDARPFFYPISSMPPYAQDCAGKEMEKINPVSYGLSPYGVCLPSAFSVTEDQADYVCQNFKKILGGRH